MLLLLLLLRLIAMGRRMSGWGMIPRTSKGTLWRCIVLLWDSVGRGRGKGRRWGELMLRVARLCQRGVVPDPEIVGGELVRLSYSPSVRLPTPGLGVGGGGPRVPERRIQGVVSHEGSRGATLMASPTCGTNA